MDTEGKHIDMKKLFLCFIFVQFISSQASTIEKKHCALYKVALWSAFRSSALPSCLARVTQGPLLFSQVFQVTTNRRCRHPKQDVAAKQKSPENKNEFSPSLSEARGRSQAERMSGCLCIIFTGCHDNIPYRLLCISLCSGD